MKENPIYLCTVLDIDLGFKILHNFCLFVLFYKNIFLHYSLTDPSSTYFGETGTTEGNKVVYIYVPLHITS